MPEPDGDIPQVKGSGDDRFAEKLEAVDKEIAGDTHDHDREGQSIASDLAQAAGVLELINRVRKREPSTDPNRHDHSNTRPEEELTADSAATDKRPRIETSHVSQRIGPYEILEQIARGGMGIVFRARDTQLNRIVALKMMLAGPFAYQEERSRFRVEAEAAAQLDHPGIVPVYDVGDHSGQLYFTMGFVDGESLSQRIGREPLDAKSAASLTAQIAAAVAYAHTRGVIHRDIKPANVLLDPGGRPRITDFGLARRTDTDSDLTRSEQVLGTPSYMAPEQASGQTGEIGPVSDIYSIGATLYCMLTGGPPFQAAGAVETLRMVIEQEPLSPRQHNPSIPQDLTTICLKCLQKEPHRRYQSAAELEAELNRFLAGQPIQARPVSWPERTWKWARRHPMVAGLSSAVLLSLLAIIAGGAWYQTRLNQTLKDLKASRTETIDSLYRALTGEADFLNQVRPLGYGTRVTELVRQASELDSSQLDPRQLRQLAVGSLGHVAARQPMVFSRSDSDVSAAAVLPERQRILFGLESGQLIVFDLLSGQRVQEVDLLQEPVVRIEVDHANRTVTGIPIRTVGRFGREVAQWVHSEGGGLVLQSRETITLQDDFLGIEPTPGGRSVIGFQPLPAVSARSQDWVTRSTRTRFTRYVMGIARADQDRSVSFAVGSLPPAAPQVRRLDIPFSPRFDVNDDFLVVGKSWMDDTLNDNSMQVIDLRTGKSQRTINTDCGALINVMISRSGRYVACGGHLGAEIYLRSSGDRLARYDNVGGCAVESFIGDEGDLLVRTESQWIWYSPRQLQPVASVVNPKDGSQLSFTATGRYAFWTGTDQPRLVDMQGDERRRIAAHQRIAKSVSFSADGRLVISTGEYNNANMTRVWDAATGGLEFEMSGSESAFSPDGRWLASWDGALKIWDIATGKLAGRATCNFFPDSIRFGPSGDRLAVSGRFPGELQVWSIDSTAADRSDFPLRLEPVLDDLQGLSPVTFSPSGQRLAYRQNADVRIHDFSDVAHSLTIQPAANVQEDGLCFLDDTRLLVLGGELQQWDLTSVSRTWVSTRPHRSPLAISPDRRLLLCQRTLIRADDLSELFELPAWATTCCAATWSPDGRRIALGLDGGDVAIWDLHAVQRSLGSLGLAASDIAISDPLPNRESVTQMLEIGRRHADNLDPQQWQKQCDALTASIASGKTDSSQIDRQVAELSDRLGRVGFRPFSESTNDDSAWTGCARSLSALANQLKQLKRYASQRLLLESMQEVYASNNSPTPELTRQVSLLFQARGDLHNFSLPDPVACLEAYRAEEQLLDQLLSQSPTAFSRSDLATDLFWLNRNMALALNRFGHRPQAIDRMKQARRVVEEFPNLDVPAEVLAKVHESLADWLP